MVTWAVKTDKPEEGQDPGGSVRGVVVQGLQAEHGSEEETFR